MDPRLLHHYHRELQHVRETGGEFAREFPKIAGRLALESLDCADPYVERLLEGFAFVAARTQLKLETSRGALARHLLETLHPAALAPLPSMLIAEVEPSLDEGSLAQGFTLERGTRLRGPRVGGQSDCVFLTASALTLWPLGIVAVTPLATAAAIEARGVRVAPDIRSGLAVELETSGGHAFSELPLDELVLHFHGADSVGAVLYEQVFAHCREVSVVAEERELRSARGPVRLERQGFDDAEALLPVGDRQFQGERLLQEYFALPARFRFARLAGLSAPLAGCTGERVTLVLQFDAALGELVDTCSAANLRLNCVPAINLFPRTADRIRLDAGALHCHVVPDRTRPIDHEVHSVNAVTGYGTTPADHRAFAPLFGVPDAAGADLAARAPAYYTVEREQRLPSSKRRREGGRSSYIGSEVFISIVDGGNAPYEASLRQLGVELLCTNRDLPLHLPFGTGQSDFTLDIGAPVRRIGCLSGPTPPRPSRAGSDDVWRLVSALSLNHLSIDRGDRDERVGGSDGSGSTAARDGRRDGGRDGAALLRRILELRTAGDDAAARRQLDGIVAVSTERVVRQRRHGGRIDLAHGLEITLSTDEAAFEGGGVYLLGAVLERYFARHASINSFTETVLTSLQRQEIVRWPVRLGRRTLA